MASEAKSAPVLRNYRLKVGMHQQTDPNDPKKKINYDAQDPKLCIVPSTIDLEKELGRDKFELVDDVVAARALSPSLPAGKKDVMDDMTIPELRRLAEDEEVDLTGLTRKEEIIAKIRSEIPA